MSGQTQPREPIAVTATFTLPSMTVISGPPFTVQPGSFHIEWTSSIVKALTGGLPVYDEGDE